MKYPKIAAALGWAESPETTEGLFLQPEECAKIESDYEAAETAQKAVSDFAAAKDTIAERDKTITGLNKTVSNLQNAGEKATDTIANRDQRITELEGQVAELGKGSSGTGTTIPTAADETKPEKVNTSALPAWDSPDHPANREADKYTRKKG